MIDFTEMPSSFKTGDPDTFEKFSAEFLSAIGYEVIVGPSRGQDGGIDLKVRDIRRGSNGEIQSEINWLVSCKHYATSKKSVGPDDEPNILERIKQHGCTGFIGLYTTIASTGLQNRLTSLNVPFSIFYNKKIENEIVGFYSKEKIFARYFPNSYKMWKETYNYLEPVKLFTAYLENEKESCKHFFESCFGSIENVIKPIRNLTSFKEMFETEGIQYVVTTIMDHKFLDKYTGEDLRHDICKYNLNSGKSELPTIASWWNIVIPLKLFNSIGFNLLIQKPRLMSFGKGNSISDFYLFPNYFFCSPHCNTLLENAFVKYKNILT